MIKLVFGNKFIKAAKKFPKDQQSKLASLLEILSSQPFHPSLHPKSLTGDFAGYYSFRITRDWRVIFKFLEVDEIKLIITGHRKDIYKKLRWLL